MERSIILDTGKGIIAGVVGSFTLALLLVAKDLLGVAPDLNLIGAFMKLAGVTSPISGWVIFFVINALIIGFFFAALDAHLERPEGWEEIARGALFGVGLWILTMILLMPMTAGGAFALNYGAAAPIFMAVAQVLQGMVMGAVYGALRPEPVMT